MTTEKEIEKLVNETKVKGEVHYYSNYISTRFKEIQEEVEKLDWRDKNSYLAGCYGVLLEAALDKLKIVDEHFKKYEG
tara:strand:+ start:483 stop:716 length:234 start_codon:yes stop_codon:yes gene_type:complete